jgi:hypothetical protein
MIDALLLFSYCTAVKSLASRLLILEGSGLRGTVFIPQFLCISLPSLNLDIYSLDA